MKYLNLNKNLVSKFLLKKFTIKDKLKKFTKQINIVNVKIIKI
jgi:hypothetical protein